MNSDKENEDHSTMRNEEIRKENDISTRVIPESVRKEQVQSQRLEQHYRDQASKYSVSHNVPQYSDQVSTPFVPQNIPQQYRGQTSNSGIPQNVSQQYRSQSPNSGIPQNVPQQYSGQTRNSGVPQKVPQQYRGQTPNSGLPQNIPQQYRGQTPNSGMLQNIPQQYQVPSLKSNVPQNVHQYASHTNYYSKREGLQRSSEINSPENKYENFSPITISFHDNRTPDISKSSLKNQTDSRGNSQERSASYSAKRSQTSIQHRRRPCSFAGRSEEDICPFYFKEEESFTTLQNTPNKVEESRSDTQKQTFSETTSASQYLMGTGTTNEDQPSTSGGREENLRSLALRSSSSSRPCSPVRVLSYSSGIPRTCSSLNSSVSEATAVCRICHGDGRREQLLSPCYCAGSIGMLHLSCLQRWLGSSNKTHCELCNFQFTMEKRPKPFTTFLRNPGSAKDKRHLICDFVCFLVLTPLTVSAVSFCLHGSLDTGTKKLESIGLSTLGAALLILYIIWLTVCIKHNVGLWRDWQQFNQDVKLKCHPPKEGPRLVPINEDPENSTMPSKGARRGTVKLCSIEINVTTSGDVSPPVRVSKKKTSGSPSPCSNTGKSPSFHSNMGKPSASTETNEHPTNLEELRNAGRMHGFISKETYV